MSEGGIVWLASYPKSGNTWLRALLSNYLRNAEQPVAIDELEVGGIASARADLDAALGYESGELSHEEAACLRWELYSYLARRARAPLLLKVHDAYEVLPDGQPMFPSQATQAVLYLVRNPLDVCVSLSHHNGHEDHALTAAQMGDDEYCLCDSRRGQPQQLRQRLRSWSTHVRSWLQAPGLRIHLLRYEDLQLAGLASLGAALRFLGWSTPVERLQRSLDFSCFAELERQERAHGFRERSAKATTFFRQGRIGTWRDALSEAVVRRLTDEHSATMQHLGYLDASGAPRF